MAGLTVGEAPQTAIPSRNLAQGRPMNMASVRRIRLNWVWAAAWLRSGGQGHQTGSKRAENRPPGGLSAGPGKDPVQGRFFSKFLLEDSSGRRPKKYKKDRQIRIIRLSQGCCFSRLTIRRAEAYIRPIGAPFRKLRLDGAPLKLLTGSVKMPPIVFGSMSFHDAFRCLAGWQVGFSDPGLFDK